MKLSTFIIASIATASAFVDADKPAAMDNSEDFGFAMRPGAVPARSMWNSNAMKHQQDAQAAMERLRKIQERSRIASAAAKPPKRPVFRAPVDSGANRRTITPNQVPAAPKQVGKDKNGIPMFEVDPKNPNANPWAHLPKDKNGNPILSENLVQKPSKIAVPKTETGANPLPKSIANRRILIKEQELAKKPITKKASAQHASYAPADEEDSCTTEEETCTEDEEDLPTCSDSEDDGYETCSDEEEVETCSDSDDEDSCEEENKEAEKSEEKKKVVEEPKETEIPKAALLEEPYTPKFTAEKLNSSALKVASTTTTMIILLSFLLL